MNYLTKKINFIFNPHRIQSLTDGVFAIAMTILVLNLDIGNPKSQDDYINFHSKLINLWPQLQHYIASFFILATFWIKNHQMFHFIKKTDKTILWLNMLSLMFICLIPFSTSIASDFSGHKSAIYIFEVNMFITGMIYFFTWKYVTKNKMYVEDGLDKIIIDYYSVGNLLIPGISIIAIIISTFAPLWGTAPYFLLPLIMVFLRK